MLLSYVYYQYGKVPLRLFVGGQENSLIELNSTAIDINENNSKGSWILRIFLNYGIAEWIVNQMKKLRVVAGNIKLGQMHQD